MTGMSWGGLRPRESQRDTENPTRYAAPGGEGTNVRRSAVTQPEARISTLIERATGDRLVDERSTVTRFDRTLTAGKTRPFKGYAAHVAHVALKEGKREGGRERKRERLFRTSIASNPRNYKIQTNVKK